MEEKSKTTQKKVNKWQGIKRTRSYQPAKFNHKGTSYFWKDLTREQIEKLADDSTFTLFERVK